MNIDFAGALNARTYGNGPQTMVLSHGFGTDQTIWENIISSLSDSFKVLVYDLPFSPNNLYDPNKYSNFSGYVDDLTTLLDELNIKEVVFVGHSMSAMIGCLAAVKRPELFKHLVLLNGSPRYIDDKETDYTGGFSQLQVDSILNAIETNYPSWVEGFAPVAVGVENETAIAKFERCLLRVSPRVALSAAKAVFLSDYRDVLPGVGVPCTVVQSGSDGVVPNSVADYMKEKLNARLIVLDAKGHFPQLTEPSLLAEVLTNWIKY